MLNATSTTGTAWNGGICTVCSAKYLGSHECSPVDLLARADELTRLAREAFERMNPEPTVGPSGGAS